MRRMTLLAACLICGSAWADSSCKPVLDSMTKYLDSPSHMVTITTRGTGAKPEVGETIHAGAQRYVLFKGQWRISPLSGDAMREQSAEDAAHSTCRVLREDSVNGEPAVVYEVVRMDEESHSHGEYYVSKITGLPIKEELDIGDQGAPERVHLSVRADYKNVQAPALGK